MIPDMNPESFLSNFRGSCHLPVGPLSEEAKKRREKQKEIHEKKWWLQNHFMRDVEYPFTVMENTIDEKRGIRMVVDSYGNAHPAQVPSRAGTSENCVYTVTGFEIITEKSGQEVAIMRLSNPMRIAMAPAGSPSRFIHSPEYWQMKVDGLGKHKCGKAFTCHCCGRYFPANMGFRVDGEDTCFCNYCKRLIYSQGTGMARFGDFYADGQQAMIQSFSFIYRNNVNNAKSCKFVR